MKLKNNIIGEYIEFVYCACNCGLTRPKYDNRGREFRFIKGHTWTNKTRSEYVRKRVSEAQRGRKRSEETLKKMSEVMKGTVHNWKGEKVSYGGLHRWIGNHLPKQELCQMCKLVPPIDCACITGIYNREFKNWARLCKKCHNNYDNITIRGWITRKK